MLTLDTLSISFSSSNNHVNHVVKGVSLEVKTGELLALVGESGSGKSLTALSIMGLLPPSAQVTGTIQFENKTLLSSDSRQLKADTSLNGSAITMVFQEPMTALNPLHTIRKQIAEILELHNPLMKASEVETKIASLLDEVGLSYLKMRLDAYPHQLSGGERQRVMIAMAVANNPKLLIADEPTTAVDVTVQKQIIALIKRLQKERGMSVLFITHDLTLVRRIADRVAVMKSGEIVEVGAVKNVFASPQHAYTKQLLASEPKGNPLPLPSKIAPLIKAEQIQVKFPAQKGFFGNVTQWKLAVDGISVTVNQGTTVGVVGESGSGKSTLGFALLRLVKSTGNIWLYPQDGTTPAPLHALSGNALRNLRRDIQIVFQDPFSSLSPRLCIEDIIAEGLSHFEPQLSAKELEARVDAIMLEVGLSPDMKHRYPHEFSGGQRQRISIARAMILKPRFVVLDEPTSALDLTVQGQILDLLKSLQSKYGLSYLFISHDLRVIRSICHHVMVMKQGRIIEEGLCEHIFTSAQSEYTKDLIDAAFAA
jgi:microcin C transport system ATP-binding protein